MSKKIEQTDKEIIEEYERAMIEHSGTDEVAGRLAKELIFHWIHQMNSEYIGYDPRAKEKLMLLCRGARQVPGLYMIDMDFTNDLAHAVVSKLWEMYESITTGWKAPEAESNEPPNSKE